MPCPLRLCAGLAADTPRATMKADDEGRDMIELDAQQQAARNWFEALRTRICTAFEAIEREAGSDAAFDYTPWSREVDGTIDADGGGGVRGVMKGRIFEKVGVNVSTVSGAFSPDFARSIHGAAEDPSFFATGISLVAHMANPHVPAVHMNTRFLATTKRWFGGGADLNPPIPYAEDTADFHAALRQACEAHPPGDYPRFAKWAEDYFWIPHRNVARGVGGIFYDHLECHDDAEFAANFALTRAVGEAFLAIFPAIVRRRMGMAANPADRETMLAYRGRYAEFNLVYDRGTLFGLKTGGNIEAILMSLPPVATWA
jgi:coproporphyrinogen III oxidase